jgi:hypothetical protein
VTRASFTVDDARRIANAVRVVELGNRNEAPLKFRRVLESGRGGGVLQIGTFTGDWPIGELKTVTFYNVTSTPNTASVRNLCVPSVGFSTSNTAEARYVIFGRVKYYTSEPVVVEIQQSTATCTLILGSVDLATIDGYVGDEEQLLGHSDGACLKWFSVTTCATATASV